MGGAVGAEHQVGAECGLDRGTSVDGDVLDPDSGAGADRAPRLSRLVSAARPVWRYGDETRGAATSSGSAPANCPTWAGSPAIWA